MKAAMAVTHPPPVMIKNNRYAGSEVIKLFSCSTQLSMKFQLLIKTKMLKNKYFSCFQNLRCFTYYATTC